MSNRERENRTLMWKLGAIALGAFGFGFALVPLYRTLCAVTGYGDQGKLLERSAAIEHPDRSRTVTVEFLTDVASAGSWDFRPEVRRVEVHPGELVTAQFYAHNLTGHDSTAQAIPTSPPRRWRPTSTRPSASASRRSISRSTRGATCRCASSSTRRSRPTST